MKKNIYEINTQDLVDELKEEESVKIEFYYDDREPKIEFYDDANFMIFAKYAFGFPNSVKHIEYFELSDFEECKDIEEYKDWLNGCFYDGVEIYKNNNYQGKIYIKFIWKQRKTKSMVLTPAGKRKGERHEQWNTQFNIEIKKRLIRKPKENKWRKRNYSTWIIVLAIVDKYKDIKENLKKYGDEKGVSLNAVILSAIDDYIEKKGIK